MFRGLTTGKLLLIAGGLIVAAGTATIIMLNLHSTPVEPDIPTTTTTTTTSTTSTPISSTATAAGITTSILPQFSAGYSPATSDSLSAYNDVEFDESQYTNNSARNSTSSSIISDEDQQPEYNPIQVVQKLPSGSSSSPTTAAYSSHLNAMDSAPQHVLGGLGSAREPNPDVQQIVNQIMPQLQKKTGQQFASLEVLSYKAQVVAGTNYFVKVLATANDGTQSIVFLRVYKDLKQNLELSALRLNQSPHTELVYFQ